VPIVELDHVPHEPFRGGATYQTLVGDAEGSAPVRIGVQTSPPGYRTPLHSHPYMEVITVLDGEGEAWIDGSDAIVALRPGTTLVLPPNVRHWFGATGKAPLKTYGVHASAHRIVDVQGAA